MPKVCCHACAMRRLVLLVTIGACAGGVEASRVPSNQSGANTVGELQRYVPAGASGCHLEGNRAVLDREDADAPVVVLMEHNIGTDWGGNFVAWADGSIAFDPVIDDLPQTRETTIPAAEVEALRAALVQRLAGHEPYIKLGLHDPVTGGRAVPVHGDETTIVVRERGGWRVSRVFGVGREEALAPPSPPSPPSRQSGALAILNYVKDPAPVWFLDAFRVALRAIPEDGAAFVPHSYLATLFTDPPRPPGTHGFPQDYGAALAWPEDVPTPPATLEPSRCDLTMQATTDVPPCRYRVEHARAAAARQLIAALHDEADRLRPVTHAGQPWLVRFDPRYRGQDTIGHLSRCITERASPP